MHFYREKPHSNMGGLLEYSGIILQRGHRTVYGFCFEILSFSGIPIIYEMYYNILKIHRLNHLILYFVYSET